MKKDKELKVYSELVGKPKRVQFVEKKKLKMPIKPKVPPVRILADGDKYICNKCHSGIVTKWFDLKKLGCRQPECENYYKR